MRVNKVREGYAEGYMGITRGRFVRSNMSIRMSMKRFLTGLAPDFCWCTAQDLWDMYRLADGCGCQQDFTKLLHSLCEVGVFERRKSDVRLASSGRPYTVYLRIS